MSGERAKGGSDWPREMVQKSGSHAFPRRGLQDGAKWGLGRRESAESIILHTCSFGPKFTGLPLASSNIQVERSLHCSGGAEALTVPRGCHKGGAAESHGACETNGPGKNG